MRNKIVAPISENVTSRVISVIKKTIEGKPPTIGLIGTCGVGKSSTINALFGTNLPTSATTACTKNFTETILTPVKRNKSIKLKILDAPGLGEDEDSDIGYLNSYQEKLEQCDVILWIMTTRNRASALDQNYLKKLLNFKEKIVFGLNQVDLTEPLNWNELINLPSEEQLHNINIIIEDRKTLLQKVTKTPAHIIPYSAKRRYNLQILFLDLLKKAPLDRAWLFESLKRFDHTDFMPEKAKLAMKQYFSQSIKMK